MKRIFFFIICLMLFCSFLDAAIVNIGIGNWGNALDNNPSVYPGRYKNGREQYLITADELIAAGAGAGSIQSVSFFVNSTNGCHRLNNYSIRLGTTLRNAFAAEQDSFATDLTTVLSLPAGYQPHTGWNLHNFALPYTWDGISNLIVQISFDWFATTTHNAGTRQSNIPQNRVLHYLSNTTDWHGISMGIPSTYRPDMQFVMAGASTAPSPVSLVEPADEASGLEPFVNLAWNPASGEVLGYHLYFGSDPEPSFWQELPADSTSFFMEDLQYGTTYYWKVVPFNSFGTAINCPTWRFTTKRNILVEDYPFQEGFEEFNEHDMQIDGWQQIRESGNRYWLANEYETSYNRTPRSGNFNATLQYNGNSWLIRPFYLEAGNNYEISVWARQDGSDTDDATIGLYWSHMPSLDEINNLTVQGITNGDYQRVSGTFSPDMDAVYWLMIHGSINFDPFYLSLDDISVRIRPETPELTITPLALNFGEVSQSGLRSLQLTFTNTGGGILNGADVEFFIEGADVDAFGLEPGSLSGELGADDTQSIEVYIMPHREGAYNATLLINYLGQSFEIPLSAYGLPGNIILIGHGTSNMQLPIYPYYGYSYSQSIYRQHEVNPTGTDARKIERIAYYWNGAGSAINSNEWTVYMGHTANNGFSSSSDWLPYSALSQVFSGTVDLPAEAGWVELELSSPFFYNGSSNLVIAVDENSSGYDAESHYFLCSDDFNNRSLRFYSDTTNPNPQAPPLGSTVAGIPNLRLQISDIPPFPVINIEPASVNFGTLLPGGSKDTFITIRNLGGIALTITGISFTGSDFYNYEPLDLPLVLGMGESVQLWTGFNPLETGSFDGSFTINYLTGSATVAVSGICSDPSIQSFPYLQDFEEAWVGSPAAPWGWKVVDNDHDNTTWNRSLMYIEPAHSGEWTAHGMGNMDDYLITPRINLTGRNVTLKWWDKVESATRPCKYRIELSNTADSVGAFTDILSDITCSNTDWEEHILDLSAYNGEYIHIAFHQYSSAASNYGFGIDDVSLEELLDIPPNPARLVYPLSGSDMVPVNPILRWNSGGGGATGYRVYLSTSNPPEYEYETFETLYHAPTLEHNTTYYWQIVPYNLFGDASDCPIWSFTTTPENLMIIGTGNLNAQLPINPYYGYSYSQSIYTYQDIMLSRDDDALPMPLKIEKIAYYWNGNGTGTNSNLWNVYMKNTRRVHFANPNDWIPISGENLVFSGTLNIPDTAGWVEIELDTPFICEVGENILIAVDENKPGYNTPVEYFYSTPAETNRSLVIFDDSMNPNPLTPSAGQLRNALPNIRIAYHKLTYDTPPSLEMPGNLYFIRNSTLELDFREYISPDINDWENISITLTPVGGGTAFNFSYLPQNLPGVPGQYLVNITSALQTAYQQDILLTARNHYNGRTTIFTFRLHLLEHFSPVFATEGIFQYTGQNVIFKDLTLGNPNYWLWDFGDGTTSTLQNPSHIYLQSGTYDVTLTLGHLQAGEESTAGVLGFIQMQGTAVDPDNPPPIWNPGGSPYNLFGELEIPDGSGLYIDAGVEVLSFSPHPMIINGSLTAAGVHFGPGTPNGSWGGLRFGASGNRNERSYLENCSITNAILPLDLQGSSPIIQGLHIAPADSTLQQEHIGIKITGDANPEITGVELLNYRGGIRIENEGSSRSLPLLSNIRIRNSGSTSRPDEERSTGISLAGNMELTNAEIENTDTAIQMQGNASPLMSNIRIRNSGSTSRNVLRNGIVLSGGISPTLTGIEMEGVEQGILILEGISPRTDSTPLLSNIRIRNSGSTSRDRNSGIIGIRAQGEHNLSLEDVELDGFDTGIKIENLSRTDSSPLLSNIRIRNSGSTSRTPSLGLDIQGAAIATIQTLTIEGYQNGIRYFGNSNLRTTASPLLSNIRIRNSGSTSRQLPGITGMDIRGLERFSCIDDSISGYQIAMKIGAAGDLRTTSTPLLSNIRIRNSGSTSREDNIGILLEDGVKGSLKNAFIEAAGTGIKINAANSTTLEQIQLFNCATGIKMAGNGQIRKLQGLLIVLEDAYQSMHPMLQFTALKLEGAANWIIQNNSISGYGKVLAATNTGNIAFTSNIAYATQMQAAPFNLWGANVNANYNCFNTAEPITGEGNIYQNPIFKGPAARNYNLGYNSPCIDSGSPLLPLDMDGTRADMGAFSYLHRASLQPDMRYIGVGTTVHFTNTSWGHDLPISTCQWDLNNDGQIDSTTRDWQYHFDTPGVYSLRLTMTTGSLEDTQIYEALIVVQAPQLNAPEALNLGIQENNIQLSWEPVNLSIGGIPQEVEYYVVYAADKPNGHFQYVGHTTGFQNSFTHVGGATAPRRFYYVIGFNGSELELREYISRNQSVLRTNKINNDLEKN